MTASQAAKWWDSAWKVVVALTVPTLLAAAGLLISLRGDILVIQTEIGHLRDQVSAQMDDRYRGSQASADLALRDARIAAVEAQIRRLEAEYRSHVAAPFHTSAIEARISTLERYLERLQQPTDGR